MSIDPRPVYRPRERKISGMTIESIAGFLKGIAKEKWLEKWARWIDELLDVYGVEDVQEVLGISDPWNLNELEQFLIEHCSGLVESECFDKIEQMIKEKGYTKELTKEATQQIEDYLKSIEKAPEIVYGLPWDIQVEVQKYRARPEIDGNKAYSIVYEFLKREGVEESEARRIAEEIASTIPKLKPEKRAEVVTNVVAMVRLAKQATLDKWMKREARAREVKQSAASELRQFVEEIYSIVAPRREVRIPEEKLISLEIPFEQLPRYGITITEAQRTKYPWETIGVITTWAFQNGMRSERVDKIVYMDLIGTVVIYYPLQKPTKCYLL